VAPLLRRLRLEQGCERKYGSHNVTHTSTGIRLASGLLEGALLTMYIDTPCGVKPRYPYFLNVENQSQY